MIDGRTYSRHGEVKRYIHCMNHEPLTVSTVGRRNNVVQCTCGRRCLSTYKPVFCCSVMQLSARDTEPFYTLSLFSAVRYQVPTLCIIVCAQLLYSRENRESVVGCTVPPIMHTVRTNQPSACTTKPTKGASGSLATWGGTRGTDLLTKGTKNEQIDRH